MTRTLTSTLLVLAGIVLVYIGASVMFSPHAFYASNEIVLGTDPSQLSEVRAPSGLLLVSGVLVALGAIRRALVPVSLTVAAVVYGSYGLSRLVGVAVDGLPSSGLVGAMGIELAVGSLAAAVLLLTRPWRA